MKTYVHHYPSSLRLRQAGAGLATFAWLAFPGLCQEAPQAKLFTKITQGSIVTDRGNAIGCAWADYDNDGYLDLFVANGGFSPTGMNDFLYRNNRDGTFTKISQGPPVREGRTSNGSTWADYDNDGDLDLFVSADFGEHNVLHQNNGDGSFTRITRGPVVTDGGDSEGCAWADFDNDGWVDLFVANGGTLRPQDFLYRNQGNGTFERVTAGPVVTDRVEGYGCSWADFDNDGDPDLYVTVDGPGKSLFRNDGQGKFTSIRAGELADDTGNSTGCAWGDYDNDGDLDLYVTNAFSNNRLYRNIGDGTFQLDIDAEPSGAGFGSGCAWADFDNDGDLDLFECSAFRNRLYQNNGDGTFAPVTDEQTITEPTPNGAFNQGCTWGDYDNDGFLDLFVARIRQDDSGIENLLYRNNGNSNTWINLRLVGTRSNRAAIGAKVRATAVIRGQTVRQMREISGGGGYNSQDSLNVEFGFGDAALIELVRIEWPSGLVQELRAVPTKQFLTITETAPGARPSFMAVRRLADGKVHLAMNGELGRTYRLETSVDLSTWSLLASITISAADAAPEYLDESAPSAPLRFYRLVSEP